ncbi:MAG TPA: hypothetical protein DCM87_18125 [Planctomycetes bacterium]|nr:hypothetical protein [Planctomycetota bacterium]
MADETLAAHIERFLEQLDLLPGLPERSGLAADLRGMGLRLSSRPRDLTYALLFGPTGCGKSRLANSLYGREASPVGYRRPTTTAPHVIVPAAHADRVLSCLPPVPLQSVSVPGAPSPSLVLIDAPDIDSVCAENRARAEAFLYLADAIAVVLTPGKYADESIWRYLRRFAAEGAEVLIVLNMFRDAPVREDLAAKLAEAGIAAPIVTVPFDPSGDREPIAECDGLARLRAQLETWGSSEALRRDALARCTRGAVARIEAGLFPWIASCGAALAALRAEVAASVRAARDELAGGLPFRLDESTAALLYRRMLANLDRADPLRLPRRILSYPFRRLRGVFGRDAATPSASATAGALWDLNEEAFTSTALDLGDALDARSRRAGVDPPAREGEEGLRARFRAFQAEFRASIDAEAAAITRTLSTGQRVRFYAAQALVLGAMVTLEVHTGGLLTLTEAIAGGIVSPFAAKLIGMALSSEESRAFSARARARYLAGAADMLAAYAAPYEDALAARIAALAAVRADGEAMCAALRARAEPRP